MALHQPCLQCKCIESDSYSATYLYNLCAGHYYDEFKTICPIVLIGVETKWPGSWKW